MDVITSEPVQALIIINVLLTLGLLFPFLTGVWSLGLPGLMCLGAYTSGYLTMEAGFSVIVALVSGSLVAAVASAPIGLLALRVHGIYLAIATLAMAELIVLFFSHFEPTGGVGGFMVMDFVPVGWMSVALILAISISVAIYRSRLGKAMIATGSQPIIAACNGINVAMLQLTALVIGGALAGLGGGLYAHFYSFISPGNFGFDRTISILLFLVAGGFTPFGAIASATFLTLVPQYIEGLETWAPAFYGVVVIIIVSFMPTGLLPKNRITQVYQRLRPRGLPTSGEDKKETTGVTTGSDLRQDDNA